MSENEILKQQRAWAEISKSALCNNIKSVRRNLKPETKLMAVVKADCYGHSSALCVPELSENGADMFAVATYEEAEKIRLYESSKPILILGNLLDERAHKAIKNGYILTLCSTENAKEYDKYAGEIGKKVKVHIKIDTGMSRLGFKYHSEDDLKDVLSEIEKIYEYKNIDIQGIFTHFAISDDKRDNYTCMQFKRFRKICDILNENGFKTPIRHCANSAAIINYPEYQMDMVRAGISLYGLNPSDTTVDESLNPVMKVAARVISVKNIKKGQSVSYVRKFIAEKDIKIAVISMGYADGLHSCFAKDGEFLINNKKAKIIGRICMDQLMTDVSDIEVLPGDTAYLITNADGFRADDVAKKYGSINYEVVCGFTSRVKRILCE